MKALLITITVLFLNIAHSDCLSQKYIDLGFYHIHKVKAEDIDAMTPDQMRDFMDLYVRRFYTVFMYLSRNIISVEADTVYPPNLIGPLIEFRRKEKPEDLREEIKFLLLHPDGRYLENLRLIKEVAPIVEKFDKEKFGKSKAIISARVLRPEEFYLTLTEKLGLRPKANSNYFRPIKENIIEPVTPIQWLIFCLVAIVAFIIGRFSSKRS